MASPDTAALVSAQVHVRSAASSNVHTLLLLPSGELFATRLLALLLPLLLLTKKLLIKGHPLLLLPRRQWWR